MDWVEDAVSYISEIVNDNYVLPLRDVLSEIPYAPVPVGKSLQNLEQLEQFLKDHEDRFIVENGKVVLRDPELETGSERAVAYFEKELDVYEAPPHYLNFRGHVGQAGEDVIYFLNTFYLKEEFKNFLLSHPEVFFVLADDTVCLIQNESVDYFEGCLENREGLRFMQLRGHLGQAPNHVIEFINTQYPGESFVEFLGKNSDVFVVDAGCCVSLKMDWVENAVLYISKILNGDALPLQYILSKIPDAPAPVRKSLRRRLRNLERLELFLERHVNRFIIENGKVAVHDPNLEIARERAVVYLKSVLELSEEFPLYWDFKEHVGQAGDDVIHFNFINTFYPGEEFKKFLLAHPDVFFVFEDETVSLINHLNCESVDYLQGRLKDKKGLHFTSLWDHLGQAPAHVIEFMKTRYPGESFLDFLENYSDAFFVFGDETVSLINDLNCESVDCFRRRLENTQDTRCVLHKIAASPKTSTASRD